MPGLSRPLPGARRLRALAKRLFGGSLVRTLFFVGLGATLLLALALLFRVEVSIELASLVLAVALVLVAWAGLHLVRHLTEPKQTVCVGYDVRLEEPLVPRVGRHVFRLEVFYELEEKRERRRVDQGTIELRFRGGDHPDLMSWCSEQVRQALERHRTLATRRFPDARVLLAPRPTADGLCEELVVAPKVAQPA